MLVVASLVDLSAIASVGSVCSLIIVLLVGIAGYRRRAETAARAPVVISAVAVTAIVLAFFAVDTLQNQPETFIRPALVGCTVVAALLLRRAGRSGDAAPGRA